MITISGFSCDICGKTILPIPGSVVTTFKLNQVPGQELHGDQACMNILHDCEGDWRKLPDGPLRRGFEEAEKTL